MKIIFETNVDQDLGLETLKAHAQDNRPLDIFAAELIQQFLANLKPRVEGRRKELIKVAIDDAADAKLTEIEAVISKV